MPTLFIAEAVAKLYIIRLDEYNLTSNPGDSGMKGAVFPGLSGTGKTTTTTTTTKTSWADSVQGVRW